MFIVEFLSIPITEIEKLQECLSFDPYKLAEVVLHNDPQNTVHFMSVMKNFPNPESERGAITMALAVGSRQFFGLEPL